MRIVRTGAATEELGTYVSCANALLRKSSFSFFSINFCARTSAAPVFKPANMLPNITGCRFGNVKSGLTRRPLGGKQNMPVRSRKIA